MGTGRFVRRSWLVSLVTAAALVASAASAKPSHAAVTIGSNLADDANEYLNCGGTSSCTVRQRNLPASSTASGGLVAPIDGVVVRWRIRVGDNTGPVALRIIRFSVFPIGNTGAGESACLRSRAQPSSTAEASSIDMTQGGA